MFSWELDRNINIFAALTLMTYSADKLFYSSW